MKFWNIIKENNMEIIVFLLFLFVAVVSVVYSYSLPFTTHGDTYVTLLANKVAADPTFPDRQLLLNLDFKPYLYTNLLDFLGKHFSIFTYKLILLFLLVLTTGYAAYLSLKYLGFERKLAVLVALIALVPRVGVGGEAWGVFASDDVLGRTLGLPFIWILSSLFIRRRFDKKTLWPVFIFSGLATYIHPVSMIFFNGLMFLIFLYWIMKDRNYLADLKDLFVSILVFSISASLLLTKIIFVTKNIALDKIVGVTASANEYADALMYRVGWDFFPQSLLYSAHFLVINFVFFIAGGYVIYNLYKKRIEKGSILYFISEFSIVLICLSVVLSFVIPNTELWLVRHFDFPFILQQTSRFFKYYYLGIYLLLAVAIKLYFQNFTKYKKTLLVLFLLVGLSSSTLGFEIFKFVVGYKNYKKEYIPDTYQSNHLPDDFSIYPEICKELQKAGIERNDLVISDYFQLRYYCETKIYTTFEEGSIYFMLGKNELVSWYRTYIEQERIINQGTPEELQAFAKKTGAAYALLETKSSLFLDFERRKQVWIKGDILSVIKFK
ncbi:hypothetical protein H0W91_02985 [Patescibacteria group bacterium]|nr:hypothetical protein [Patescibacteria group bacterium]